MKSLNEMTSIVALELIRSYENGYFNLFDNKGIRIPHTRENLQEAFNMDSFNVIKNMAKICTEEEYLSIKNNPAVLKNIYDEAFDRGARIAIQIIFGEA